MKKAKATPPTDVPDRNDVSDADAFERAMSDVVRRTPDPRGRVPLAPLVSTPPPATSSNDDVDDPDESYVAPGVDRREIRKLKRGEYAAADSLDLHGQTAAEASASAERFIENSRHRRHRCVCIVHGRGLHSEGKAAILKARVREYLRSQRAVLAYADAPRSAGGAGAVYVLLRK